MSLDKLTKASIRSGHSAQCKFCKQALPYWWVIDPAYWQATGRISIEESGYCTYCNKFADIIQSAG